MDLDIGYRVISASERIIANFDAMNWDQLGLLTGQSGLIDKHPRLLRSLSWHDEDYAGNSLAVIKSIVQRNPEDLEIIEEYLNQRFPGESEYVSAKPSERKITFAPNVFQVPDGHVQTDLVAVMMPFAQEFTSVYEAIRDACKECGLDCLRADDIWEEDAILQDIFNLIFRAKVVIVDFTGKNPNVMYETGMAHTLGKHVVPITQSLVDVPSDIAHHRTLKYLLNSEGLAALQESLTKKLKQFCLGGNEQSSGNEAET
jgi:hypothetical protein